MVLPEKVGAPAVPIPAVTDTLPLAMLVVKVNTRV